MINLLINNETKLKIWPDPQVKKFLVGLKKNYLLDKVDELEKVPQATINVLKKEWESNWDVEKISKANPVAGIFAKYLNAMYDVWGLKK